MEMKTWIFQSQKLAWSKVPFELTEGLLRSLRHRDLEVKVGGLRSLHTVHSTNPATSDEMILILQNVFPKHITFFLLWLSHEPTLLIFTEYQKVRARAGLSFTMTSISCDREHPDSIADLGRP